MDEHILANLPGAILSIGSFIFLLISNLNVMIMKKPKIISNSVFIILFFLWLTSWVAQLMTIVTVSNGSYTVLLYRPWFMINIIGGFILMVVLLIKSIREKCYVYSIIPFFAIILLITATYIASKTPL